MKLLIQIALKWRQPDLVDGIDDSLVVGGEIHSWRYDVVKESCFLQ